jgi:preprotein translocase subunit YajC
VTSAFAQTADAPAASPPFLVTMFPVLAVLAVFYLILIRPEMKKRKEQDQLLSNLKRNDQVVLSSGIHGRVMTVGKTLSIEIAPKVQIQVESSAIQTVQKAPAAEVREKEREKEKS